MEWNDLEKIKPEHCICYKAIVAYENDMGHGVCEANYVNDEFCVYYNRDLKPIVGVTHWQDMPEHPTVE